MIPAREKGGREDDKLTTIGNKNKRETNEY
jgi:hypothetical protein